MDVLWVARCELRVANGNSEDDLKKLNDYKSLISFRYARWNFPFWVLRLLFLWAKLNDTDDDHGTIIGMHEKPYGYNMKYSPNNISTIEWKTATDTNAQHSMPCIHILCSISNICIMCVSCFKVENVIINLLELQPYFDFFRKLKTTNKIWLRNKSEKIMKKKIWNKISQTMRTTNKR